MAEFHGGAARRREDDRGSLVRHGAHGSAVCALWRPSRPCLPGRSPRSRRDAVLHERLCPRPRETRGLTHPHAPNRSSATFASDTYLIEPACQYSVRLAGRLESVIARTALRHETDLDHEVTCVAVPPV